MKLITEVVEEINILTEEKNGNKTHFIEGIFLQSNLKNRNGRVYPKEIMAKEVERYNESYVKANRALGELGHPDGPSINLDRVSHMIVSLKEDGDNYIGKAKLMDTPMGNIAKGLIEGGAKLGVSSRGMGTLKPNKEGINEVQDDFYLATAADIVADPSAPDAFVQGIMEGKEWVVVNGVWMEQQCDMTKRYIKKASKKELEEAKLRVFESFLNRVSRKTKFL
jgi:hypothetical protein